MSVSVYPQLYIITRKERNIQNNHNSFVLWLTGLSGSGKSSIANLLEKCLFERGLKSYILDGDNTRLGINSDLDFSTEGRKENIRRVSEIAKLMNDAGLITIACFISPFENDRQMAKEIIGEENFIEVFVDCPLEICEKRDVKGLYAKARKGEVKNFTGVSSPFEVPSNPEIIISTHLMSAEDCVKTILNKIETKLNL
jgi:adenylylsulfate kinase